MSLVLDNPLQPVLRIPPDLSQWGGDTSATDAAAQWRLYLHQLGAPAVVQWCQEAISETTDSASVSDRPLVQLWPNSNPLDIWHVVDGLAVTIGARRIVVILSEAMDASEMQVPQEWVDLPDWAGDYYICACIDVDEQQLALWGYATYSRIKQQGQYDADERLYCLAEDHIIQDFSAFWVAQQLESLGSVTIESIPAASSTQLDNLISRLASSPEPRLEVPFRLWGALISDPDLRSRFYQQRHGGDAVQTGPTQLSQWTAQLLSQGWNSLAALLPQSPAVSVRSGANTASIPTTGAKEIIFETADGSVVFVLALSITVEADERRNIRIRLYPMHTDAENAAVMAESLLPAGVTLSLLLTETQQPLQSVDSGDRDNYIQMPPFRCPAGEAFSVRIQYMNSAVQEDFVS